MKFLSLAKRRLATKRRTIRTSLAHRPSLRSRRDARDAPRVFLGLSDICGYYSQLEAGLAATGLDCRLLDAFPVGEYERTSRPDRLGRAVEWLGRRRARAERGSAFRLFWKVFQAAALAVYAVSSLRRYDVYIFASGYSFLGGIDLPLLKWFGKRVIAVFHGSDSRPAYMNAAVVGIDGPIDAAACIRHVAKTKRWIRRVEQYADVIVNHCLTGHLHERPFVNWYNLGIPTGPAVLAAADTLSRSPITPRRFVILHAPTRPGPKGTAHIEAAVESLRSRGYDLELVKIVGRPNREVLAAIRECDFVVDELFSDSTMASFATEAALLSRPAVVGTYGLDALRRYCNVNSIPPAVVCRPFEVEKAIESLIRDPAMITEMGQKAHRFVESCWNRDVVGARYRRLIEDDIPSEWWFDPRDLEYANGWGLTEDRLTLVLREVLATGGRDALHVADKPHLERALIDRAARRADA